MACISAEELAAILIGTELSGNADAAYRVSYAVSNADLGDSSSTGNNSGFSFGIIQLDIGVNGNAQAAYAQILNDALQDGTINQETFNRLIRYNGESRYDLDPVLSADFDADRSFLNDVIFAREEVQSVVDFFTNKDLEERVLPKVDNFLDEMQAAFGNEHVFDYFAEDYHTAVAAIVSVVNRTNSTLNQSIAHFKNDQPTTLDDVMDWFEDLIVPTFGAIKSEDWNLIVTGGQTYSNFDKRLEPVNSTVSFADAIVELGFENADDLATAFLRSELGNCVSNVSYTGSSNAAFLVSDFEIAGSGIDLEGGIMLSSGGFPGSVNTAPNFSVIHGTAGDSDLNAVAAGAFAGAGTTFDASVLEFEIFIDDEDVDGLRFDVVFGSDEFSEFSNSSFVDVAAIFVNGDNKALFNGDPSTPLSVIDANLALNFVDNEGAQFGTEWDGFGGFTVRPELVQGLNTIKIAVADTGDSILDSGLYVTNFELLRDGATGNDPLKVVNGVLGANDLEGTAAKEEFNLAGDVGSVFGTLFNLNGDIITGFDEFKKLVFEFTQLLDDQIEIVFGSAILNIDEDGDGVADSVVTLEGDFEDAIFNVDIVGANTEVTVEFASAPPPVDPDVINGTTGRDVLVGTDADELFDGKGGNDVYTGNGGADTFKVTGQFPTILDFTIGEDTLDLTELGVQSIEELSFISSPNGLKVSDEVSGSVIYLKSLTGVDALPDDSFVFADPEDLTVIADNTGQSIFGRAGNDRLISGEGRDRMTGNEGDDIFVMNGSAFDIITDFGLGGDQLDVSAWDVASLGELRLIERPTADLIEVVGNGHRARLLTEETDLQLADLGVDEFIFA